MDLDRERIEALTEAESSMFHSDFCPYLELKGLLLDTRDLARRRFQTLFTNYYRLNAARLSPAYKERFFAYLFSGKGIVDGRPDLQMIIDEVGAFDRGNGVSTVQYSFVSKLAGILCESSPLYDRQVRRFFGTREVKSVVGFVEFLREVAGNYQLWVDDERIKPIIRRFKARDSRLEQCHVVRLIDFLVWKSGEGSF